MKRGKKMVSSLLASALIIGLLPVHAQKAEAAEARKSLPIQKTLTEPIIDGSLDESVWSVNQDVQKVLNGEGADALRSKFGMTWDSKYLYIGVATEDSNLANSPNVDKDPANVAGDYYWDHPNVTIFLDPTLHQSEPYQGKDVQLGFVYKPNTTTPYFSFGAADTNKNRDEKQILRAIKKTDKGWNLEAAIPWKFLDFDPQLMKQLGMEMTVGTSFIKEGGKTVKPSLAWSAFESQSFWNDTRGYGTVKLEESSPVSGQVNDILLNENFDGYANGQIPFGWISNVSGSSKPFGVINDVYGDGRLVFDDNASGKQARIFAPVQWDNYVVEADLQFQGVIDSGRWASLMFRAPSAGVHPYNQMAVRQSGAFEIALRNASNGWDVPVKGNWGKALDLNKDYSFKVRVFDNNVKEYLKAADSATYDLLTDKWMNSFLLERGKVGFQADQSKVSVKSLKVTRIRVENLDIALPAQAEALTGPIGVQNEVTFSDGIKEAVPADRIKWSTSNANVVRVVDNQLVPLQAGTATLTAVYDNAVVTRQIQVTPSLQGKQVASLRHHAGYLLANVDEAMDLNGVEFQAEYNDFSTGTVKGGELTWNADSGIAVISGGKLTPKQKGMHKVRVSSGSGAIDMIVVAKPAAESEYVLYEQDFTNLADGALPDGWKIVEQPAGTTAGVKNGAFEINATAAGSAVRVLLPAELKLFGNYKIEADATHVKANDAARWHSIMYRVQNDNYPYYQMAVRQNATASNGVEFAERTPANGWNVMEAKSYKEAIQPDKLYHYTVKAYGDRVQQFVNDELVVNTGAAQSYLKGGIGLQANGSLMKVARVKVTLQQEALPKLPDSSFVNVMEPATKIALAPTVVGAIESADQALVLNPAKLPATVMLHVNEALQVTAMNKEQILTPLKDALSLLGGKAIPAFYVHDQQTVVKLVDYLRTEGIADAFVVSDRPELVKQARVAYPIVRGIVDFPQAAAELTHEQLMDIRRTTNASLAKIALLPERAASPDQVEYLQERLITVWAKQAEQAFVPDAVSHHRLITAGVNGIVTRSPETLVDALAFYNHNTTLIRKPWIIGHRGIPGLAPENTLESAILAYEKGADIVENDVYITKDDKVVIIHDDTLDRTTTGTGKVEDYTLAELKKLLANKQFPDQYPAARIPTLEEFFQEFKGKDLLHFIEIKTYNPRVIDPMLALIKQYDVEDQVVMISFIPDQIKRINDKLPGMSNGLLTGGQANDTDISRSLYRVLDTVQPLNTTFNTSYPGFGKPFLEASKHRGITVWPWTYRDINEYKKAFAMGVYGLTNDYSHWSSDWADRIRPAQDKVELKIGGQADLKASVRTYKGATTVITPEVAVLSGHDLIEVNGGTVKAKRGGTAYVALRYTQAAADSPVYDMYTQPVAIEVKDPYAPLRALIEEAQISRDTAVEGDDAGQYPAGAKASLQAAINKAKNTADRENATSEELAAAESELLAALKLFKSQAHDSSPKSIAIDQPTVNLPLGKSVKLHATVQPSYAYDKTVTWSVYSATGDEVVKVTPEGEVSAHGFGTAVVRAKSVVESVYADSTITVDHASEVQVEEVKLDRTAATLTVGEKLQLKAEVVPGDALNRTVVWSVYGSTPANAAAVTNGGLVTALSPGTAVIRAASGGNASKYAEMTLQVKAAATPGPEQPGTTDPVPLPAPTTKPADKAPEISNGHVVVEGKLEQANSTAKAAINAEEFAKALKGTETGEDGVKKIRIEVKGSQGAANVELSLPPEAFAQMEMNLRIEIVTEHAVVTLPSNFLKNGQGKAGEAVSLVVSKVDHSQLSPAQQQQIGSSPVINLDVKQNGQVRAWSNPEAPVQVSIPYTPSAAEMKNPNGIVIWYLGAGGKAEAVPSGKFDPAAKSVRFTVNHFSRYAVAFVDKTFADLAAHAWAKASIDALAARDVIQGMEADAYGPALDMTRADFVTILVRALGLQAAIGDNFKDVTSSDYYYETVGIAKKLGLIEGQDGNSFNPKGKISRQDLFTIVSRALSKTSKLSLSGSASVLAGYSDGSKVAAYAIDSVSGLIAAGLVEGSGNALNPEGFATRAETAVMMNRILNKIYE
ncbi:glycerophosphodiester phosphodiesterase family protein [Paenibacillus sp. MBLB4367]|uniref:glycerophosphodiester phosphodiesterase family protein n=1 Tax=Paenibacillus sp. MBLB4367 TaxID=3384767 RepID=UPI003907F556